MPATRRYGRRTRNGPAGVHSQEGRRVGKRLGVTVGVAQKQRFHAIGPAVGKHLGQQAANRGPKQVYLTSAKPGLPRQASGPRQRRRGIGLRTAAALPSLHQCDPKNEPCRRRTPRASSTAARRSARPRGVAWNAQGARTVNGRRDRIRAAPEACSRQRTAISRYCSPLSAMKTL